MLKLFSSLFLLFIFGFSVFVYATPYQWNTSEIDLQQTSVGLGSGEAGVLVDIDDDGKVDSFYVVYDSGTNLVTIDKVWGSLGCKGGQYTIDYAVVSGDMSFNPNVNYYDVIGSYGDWILFSTSGKFSTTSVYKNVNKFDASTCTFTKTVVSDLDAVTNAPQIQGTVVGVRESNSKVILIWETALFADGGLLRVVEETTGVLHSDNAPSSTSYWQSSNFFGGDTSNAYTINNVDLGDVDSVTASSSKRTMFGNCNEVCFYDDGSTGNEIAYKDIGNALTSNLALGLNIPYYNFGMNFSNSATLDNLVFGSMSVNPTTIQDYLMHLDYNILDSTLTSSPYRVYAEDKCVRDGIIPDIQLLLDNNYYTCKGELGVIQAGSRLFIDSGHQNNAGEFDNVLYVNWSDLLTIDYSKPFTVTMWIWIDGNNTDMVFGNLDATGAASKGFAVLTELGGTYPKILFRLNDESTSHDVRTVEAAAVLQTGAWYFVSVRYDGLLNRDGIEVCINDQTYCYSGTTSTILNNIVDKAWAVGGTSLGAVRFDGKVDDIRVYSGSLLSDVQVNSIYTDTYSSYDLNGYVNNNAYVYYDPNINDNRALTFYTLDTNPPTLANLQYSDGLTDITSLELVTPTTTYQDTFTIGGISTLSGYYHKSQGISRFALPELTNGTSFPYLVGTNSSQTTVTVNIKNAPTDFSVYLEDSRTFEGVNYIWSVMRTTADKSFVVDLPNGQCVTIYGRDTSDLSNPWEDLGEICANGVMPKQISYLSDLSFTFWTLPWGTSHRYNHTAYEVDTLVRHTTLPYSYYVDVLDKDGNLVSSDYQTVTVSSPDTQNYNLTGIDFPAKLIIKDGSDNSTLYTAVLGYPSYLSQVGAFFNQFFEVEGFNLLYMLPIIFAAMFTRSSVGIGTGLTVAFIALLSWLGLIVIEETIIYIMVFVAIIGMIAYAKIRS